MKKQLAAEKDGRVKQQDSWQQAMKEKSKNAARELEVTEGKCLLQGAMNRLTQFTAMLASGRQNHVDEREADRTQQQRPTRLSKDLNDFATTVQ